MPDAPLAAASQTIPDPVLPVSLLNRLARERLETGFPLCWVSGEISNLTYASSGHLYFSLKDAAAQVRCVMFRNRAQMLGWRLENGQHIEARVLVTLYETRGDFQLNVEDARKAGTGSLYERFLRLKDSLEKEGLFAAQHKRPLPAYPACIGVITSPQAAALQDVLSTLRRRAPQIPLIIYPTPVQGSDAAAQIVAALQGAGERAECDVLILCRGGGSLEDLWAFNDEALARAIRSSPLPLVTGIGHQTDFTIADFAADHRAPTPTAAAELVAPERTRLLAHLNTLRCTLRRQIEHPLAQRIQTIDALERRLQHPARRLTQLRDQLAHLQHRLNNALSRCAGRQRTSLAALNRRLILARPDTGVLDRRITQLAVRLQSESATTLNARALVLTRIAASLTHLNPHAVLARGYSIVSNAQGKILSDSGSLEPNEPITVCFHKGRVEATVKQVKRDPPPSSSIPA